MTLDEITQARILIRTCDKFRRCLDDAIARGDMQGQFEYRRQLDEALHQLHEQGYLEKLLFDASCFFSDQELARTGPR